MNRPLVFKKSQVAAGLACALAAAAMPSHAVSWSKGDWDIKFDSAFTLATSIRVEDRNFDLIGKNNQPQLDWTGYSINGQNRIYQSQDVWAQPVGGYSANGDLGNLNFDRGEAFSTQFRGLHELEVRYKNFGLFMRGFYFHDFELNSDRDYTNPITGVAQDPCASPEAERWLCNGANLLDAFVFADFEIAGAPTTVRVGNQVINWGESTFLQHGINTINPVNVTQARAPGAELREIFLPVGTAAIDIDLTDNFSLSAYYQYEWEASILPQAGSYFATNDFAGYGGQQSNIQLSFTANPDINLDFLLNSLNELGGLLNAGLVNQEQAAGLLLTHATRNTIRGYQDAAWDDPSNGGQYGLRATYFAEELGQTEFSAYLINYHSKLPIFAGVAADYRPQQLAQDLAMIASGPVTRENIIDLDSFSELRLTFPEDIKLYGFSFNTNIGETAVAGEIAYRQDEPLQIDDVELLYAAFPQQLANIGARDDLDGISQLNNLLGRQLGPGERAEGFIESDTMQISTTISHVFGPAIGTDNFVLLGEVGYVDIRDMPDPNFLRLNGPGTARTASLEPIVTAGGQINNREGLHQALSDGPETTPFPTDDAWGYRIAAIADFNRVFSGTNLQVRTVFSHDVDGITPDPLFLFYEGRKSATVSFNFDYLAKWQAFFSYNAFWGGEGQVNQLQDRDFISFGIRYNI